MQKSFIERLFPRSPGSILPQHEYRDQDSPPSTPSTPRIVLRDDAETTRSIRSSGSNSRRLKPSPLSASIVHHDDPFLPIDRAAQALQNNIQALLDIQSDRLSAGLGRQGEDDLSSVGSPTPTPSLSSPSKSSPRLKTVPIRQPRPKRVTLRGARRGLARSMTDFAQLKEEELRVLENEEQNRQAALQQAERFEDKKVSLRTKIDAIQEQEGSARATNLRAEAQKMDQDIQELETKLLEMRARHRQLLSQATQLESSVDSKLSSYKSSLDLVEDQIKQFLRQPPVTHGLIDRRAPDSGAGMYALRPERRTLQLARDQWSVEREMLSVRKVGVREEKQALEEGARLWHDAVIRITAFEKELRTQTRTVSNSQMQSTLLSDHVNGDTSSPVIGTQIEDLSTKLSEVISSLESDLTKAEANGWNLLICCLGAELVAFEEARDVLQESSASKGKQVNGRASKNYSHDIRNASEDLMQELTSTQSARDESPSASSNRSLEDTLREFGDGTVQRDGIRNPNNLANSTETVLTANTELKPVKTNDSRSESEDDDPGPDFFLSHT